jgi:asparagine synthase (glutamine-hydrolysing)
MTDSLVHRGPDDFGYLLLDSLDGSFALGQDTARSKSCDLCLGSRRLAIIDLTANGRQPLGNETGDVFVVHNGEIYNHLELREVLESKGHVFRSRTDTETIVHAYEEWGRDCVARFNGMWAFAVWDQRSRELFCSRDRFGAKPFYYYLDDGVFVFASEIKGILPALTARPRPNHGVVADYLVDGSVCRSAETFFDGIQRLQPAHNLVISAGASLETRYWDYTTQSEAYDQHDPLETFAELLHDAVQLRLRSDVPVGVALSGGLDSTAILAESSSGPSGQPLHAFTAIFPGDRFDEHEYARLAACHCGAELDTVVYSPEGLLEDLRSVTWHLDYPALLPQVLPRWSLMRLASRKVKVILEGQGADELLAGYAGSYVLPYLRDQWSRLGSGERGDALRDLFAASVALYQTHGMGGFTWMLRREVMRRLRTRDGACTRDFLTLRRGQAAEVAAPLFRDRMTRQMHDDHARAQLPMLLKFGDAISMAHSLESRLPFLDYRLVEFVFGLPVRHKFHRGRSKVLLRQAMTGAIPERIRLRRDKVGFETPLTRWMGQRLDTDLRPVLLSDRVKSRGVLDSERLRRLLTPQALRRPAAAQQAFQCLSVELWFRMFIDGDGAPSPVERPVTAESWAYASPAPP